jgi:hypothetical protein
MNRHHGLLAAVALVLLATLVVGSENREREAHLVPAVAVMSPAPALQPQPRAGEELDVEKLHRARQAHPIVDVFAHRTAKVLAAPLPAVLREAPRAPPPQAAAPEAAVPAPPPAPPALPYRLVARFVENGATRLLLANGDKEHNVSGGETLDGAYRVDSISDQAVAFTYLPLNAAQTLELARTHEAAR